MNDKISNHIKRLGVLVIFFFTMKGLVWLFLLYVSWQSVLFFV